VPTKAELEKQRLALVAERDTLARRLDMYMQALVVIVQTLDRAQSLDGGEQAPTLGLDQAERYDAAIEQVLALIGRLQGGEAASPLEGAVLVVGGYSGARRFPREFTLYRAGASGSFEKWNLYERPETVEALLTREGYRCVAPIRDEVLLGLYLKEGAAEGGPAHGS
jgi:hypothetical protein